MKCKVCGNNRFVGHQLIRADVYVDEFGEFDDYLEDGLAANVFDSEKPYGPFYCSECGAEYENLNQ